MRQIGVLMTYAADDPAEICARQLPAASPGVGMSVGLWDVDSFIVLSEQDIGIGHGQAAMLANGAARYVVEGKFERDGAGVGQPGFASEIDADESQAMTHFLRAALLGRASVLPDPTLL
jgi:hypothetical protein